MPTSHIHSHYYHYASKCQHSTSWPCGSTVFPQFPLILSIPIQHTNLQKKARIPVRFTIERHTHSHMFPTGFNAGSAQVPCQQTHLHRRSNPLSANIVGGSDRGGVELIWKTHDQPLKPRPSSTSKNANQKCRQPPILPRFLTPSTGGWRKPFPLFSLFPLAQKL